MNSFTGFLTRSPVTARVAPLVVYLVLTVCQGYFGESGRYWLYLAKTLAGAWVLWVVWPVVTEMRWAVSWESLVVGVVVFALWVGLDPIVPTQPELWEKLGLRQLFVKLRLAGATAASPPPWNPFRHFGPGSELGWLFVCGRILGSSLVVPPIEEVFYRSFLYRWIAKDDFLSVPLGHFAWKPFVITSAIFGFAHNEWLAGILCGFAYQGLVCWKKRLGDAIAAHAVTNFLLGLWVVWRDAWQFW